MEWRSGSRGSEAVKHVHGCSLFSLTLPYFTEILATLNTITIAKRPPYTIFGSNCSQQRWTRTGGRAATGRFTYLQNAHLLTGNTCCYGYKYMQHIYATRDDFTSRVTSPVMCPLQRIGIWRFEAAIRTIIIINIYRQQPVVFVWLCKVCVYCLVTCYLKLSSFCRFPAKQHRRAINKLTWIIMS